MSDQGDVRRRYAGAVYWLRRWPTGWTVTADGFHLFGPTADRAEGLRQLDAVAPLESSISPAGAAQVGGGEADTEGMSNTTDAITDKAYETIRHLRLGKLVELLRAAGVPVEGDGAAQVEASGRYYVEPTSAIRTDRATCIVHAEVFIGDTFRSNSAEGVTVEIDEQLANHADAWSAIAHEAIDGAKGRKGSRRVTFVRVELHRWGATGRLVYLKGKRGGTVGTSLVTADGAPTQPARRS